MNSVTFYNITSFLCENLSIYLCEIMYKQSYLLHVETINHFRCIDYIIDHAEEKLTEAPIKELHRILKTGTSDSRKDWFNMGDYKRLPNEVG